MTAMRREREGAGGGVGQPAARGPRRLDVVGKQPGKSQQIKGTVGVSIWRATITYQTQTTCATSETEGAGGGGGTEGLTYY